MQICQAVKNGLGMPEVWEHCLVQTSSSQEEMLQPPPTGLPANTLSRSRLYARITLPDLPS